MPLRSSCPIAAAGPVSGRITPILIGSCARTADDAAKARSIPAATATRPFDVVRIMASSSSLRHRSGGDERGHVDPAPLGIAAVGELGQLDALGALEQRERERRVLRDMAQEQLPAGAITV